MSEFRLHHDVSELLSLLRVGRGGEGAEVYMELLQKHRGSSPFLTTTVSALGAKVKLAEFSRTPEDFLTKYDELKSRNTRHLDSLVSLLAQLAGHKEMTAQELEELRKQLGTVTTTSTVSALQPLEFVRKMLREKQNKKSSGQPVPSFPAWVYERPALLGDFLTGSSLSTDTAVPIASLVKLEMSIDATRDLSKTYNLGLGAQLLEGQE
ncbi:UNVERIFIED_CONTAM: hypothetical protein K2H54_002041 [Gekko kuhli]